MSGPETEGVQAPGPWERKRLRTSLEIEAAGLRLIARSGLDGVTVEQVAAAAGISPRTFFRYFRNVPDLLTRVPHREVEQVCGFVMARPAEESLLDAFRSALDTGSARPPTDNADLRAETLVVWSEIAQADRESVEAAGHALAVMRAGFEEVIAARLGLEPDRDMTAGVLASALAGVVWYTYLRFLESGAAGSFSAVMEEALGDLQDLCRGSDALSASGHARPGRSTRTRSQPDPVAAGDRPA